MCGFFKCFLSRSHSTFLSINNPSRNDYIFGSHLLQIFPLSLLPRIFRMEHAQQHKILSSLRKIFDSYIVVSTQTMNTAILSQLQYGGVLISWINNFCNPILKSSFTAFSWIFRPQEAISNQESINFMIPQPDTSVNDCHRPAHYGQGHRDGVPSISTFPVTSRRTAAYAGVTV